MKGHDKECFSGLVLRRPRASAMILLPRRKKGQTAKAGRFSKEPARLPKRHRAGRMLHSHPKRQHKSSLIPPEGKRRSPSQSTRHKEEEQDVCLQQEPNQRRSRRRDSPVEQPLHGTRPQVVQAKPMRKRGHPKGDRQKRRHQSLSISTGAGRKEGPLLQSSREAPPSPEGGHPPKAKAARRRQDHRRLGVKGPKAPTPGAARAPGTAVGKKGKASRKKKQRSRRQRSRAGEKKGSGSKRVKRHKKDRPRRTPSPSSSDTSSSYYDYEE